MENSHTLYHKMFTQNEQGGSQFAFSPSDFARQQMGRMFLVSMCLVAIVIPVKVSVQGLIELLNQNVKPPLSATYFCGS